MHQIEKVLAEDLCAGCGGCAVLSEGSIEMAIDDKGFLRPAKTSADWKMEDGAFSELCPSVKVDLGDTDEAFHPDWGRVLHQGVGYATDPEIRHQASSGGMLSAILLHLVESDQVDRVLQTNADPNDPISNTTTISKGRDEILQASGSRYAPSSPMAEINEALATGLRFVFVGKPCDVYAMSKLREFRPDVAQAFPILISFFCAGVPSRLGAVSMLEKLDVGEQEVQNFRYRGFGWPGRATVILKDLSQRSLSYEESWGSVLSKHLQLRCKICVDGIGHFADMVFADAWHGSKNGYPEFEDRPGRSLFLARTDLGRRILTEAVAASKVDTETFDVDAISAIQPGQTRRRRNLKARLLGLRLIGRQVPDYRGFELWRAASKGKPSEFARNFLGVIRRSLWARRARSEVQ